MVVLIPSAEIDMIQNWITGFPGINNILIITENNKITAIAFSPLKIYFTGTFEILIVMIKNNSDIT